MTLYEIQKNYTQEASLLGDYQNMSKTYLANQYCDCEEAMWAANDKSEHDFYDAMRGRYLSALMLRYWYKAVNWKNGDASSLNYSDEDYANMLYMSLWVAFYYKQWRYEYKAEVKDGKFIDWKYDEEGNRIPNPYYYVNDDTAVDKIINRCCMSWRGREYQKMNKDVRKANVLLYSLDAQQENVGDCALESCGCFSEPEIRDGTRDIVDLYLKRNDYIEALVIDGIVHNDVFKVEKNIKDNIYYDEDGNEQKNEVTINHSIFDKRKLAKHLRELTDNDLTVFCERYDIIDKEPLMSKFKKLTGTKINQYIDKTLIEIKQNKEMLSCLN